MSQSPHILVIGAGVGGLSAAALLAQVGYRVTVLEAQTYPGGSASSYSHKGFIFESGATVAGGFQPNGPHHLIAQKLGITWNVHQHDPAWVAHLPDRRVALTQDHHDVLANFPASRRFWEQQSGLADLAWRMSAQGLPWPPRDWAELVQLLRVGVTNFPADLRLVQPALTTIGQWLKRLNLHQDASFVRFLDSILLISAQTTTTFCNALYGATALDLSRQGVYHVKGGIGGIAQTLVDKVCASGGEVLYRRFVTRIAIQGGRVIGVYAKMGRRTRQEDFYPADFVIANTTPWSLEALLGDAAPPRLRAEVARRTSTWGAFVLHLGLDASRIPADWPDHHQLIETVDGPLGEGHTAFLSMSPVWDYSRAPQGQRAATISTHTRIQDWYDLLQRDENAYYARKEVYTARILALVDRYLPNFSRAITLTLPGTPVTYEFYTLRQRGMVGGFPQTSLFKARSPRTGIPNLRLVGDSIFPGQSTAGVTLGAIRVAEDVRRHLPLPHRKSYSVVHPTQEPVP
ncbi:MAG: NAD(P)/FAD-dependent oxidoreductase [Anaerolineae bacterium]|nr:NAD(P)/FAD-dependent oxidoreductase [Anaerolineae bacterium]